MLPDDLWMAKRQLLRREVLALRDKLSVRELDEKSRAITDRLWRIEGFAACRTVMFYASFRNEVRTGAAIARCLGQGYRVALPLTEPKNGRLLPYLLEDPDRDLRPGYCSIPEPDPARAQPLSPHRIEAVVLPGAVFDERGGRLGYGGGYYDRFLAREAPAALRIGLAFEMQLMPEDLPLAPHDQLLHYLVTEERTIHVEAAGDMANKGAG